MRAARRYVTPPTVAPRPYGLLSVAQVIEDNDPHLGSGVEYETHNCGVPHETIGECYERAIAAEAPADLTVSERRTFVEGDPFVVYALDSCNLVGSGGRDAIEQRARELLTAVEPRGIERGFERQLLEVADDITPTAGVALSPLDGLAVLEEFAATNYAGVATIHMPAGTATRLGSHSLTARAGRLETVNGNLVAAGGGYGQVRTLGTEADPGTEAPDGARWLFVTGAVVVRRGGVEETGLVVDHAAPASNIYHALAQREVVVTAECMAAAVLVSGPVSGSSSGGSSIVDNGDGTFTVGG